MATGLKEREELAGNEADSFNPGQKNYDQEFNNQGHHDDIEGYDRNDDGFDDLVGRLDDEAGSAPKTRTNSDGEEVNRNYNADENIKSAKEQEESGGPDDSLYNKDANQGRQRFSGLKAKLKKAGPTSGIMAVVLGGVAGGSFFLSPAGLFVAIEKNVTNDGSDSARTNTMLRRAYIGGILGGAKCDDESKKLRCKMTTITKQQVKKWRADGFRLTGTKVDKDGKALPGADGREGDVKDGDFKDKTWRVKVKSIMFPSKVVATNGAEFNEETKRNLESRRFANRVVNNRAAFFMNAKFNKVLAKFNLSKSSITKKEPDVTRDKAASLVAEEKSKAEGKMGGMSDKLGKAGGVFGFATSGVGAACGAYNMTRLIVGGIKAKWVADIIAYAFPFVQLGSKIANEGNLSDSDRQLLDEKAGALTWYQSPQYTEKMADKKQQQIDDNNMKLSSSNSEEEQEEIIDTDERLKTQKQEIIAKQDLSGTDAQGLRMAMYGDTTALKSFTENYTTGGIASVMAMQSVLDKIRNGAGGKQNIRQICIQAGRGGYVAAGVSFIGCTLGSVLTLGAAIFVCAGAAAASFGLYIAAAYGAMKLVEKAIVAAIKNGDFSSDLRGVDAGNALAAGIGLMLSHGSRGNGLKPASKPSQVKKFITATDADYYRNGEELARYEARDEPFNMYNQYSFAGQLAYSLNPYIAGQKTVFGYAANAMALMSKGVGNTASALHSQPSLMTNNDENLNHRLNVTDPSKDEAECRDSEMQDAGLMCDWSGRMVGYTSERVLMWADQQERGTHDRFSDTLDYMLSEQSAGEEDGGTYDETCNDSDNIVSELFTAGSCGEDSKKPSIKEDGSANEGSQYDMYIKYCAEDRELEMGSTSDTVENGTAKDQDWQTGKQCGKESLMMDHFAYYYNMCTVQFATANNTEDCTSDTDLGEEEVPSDCVSEGGEPDPKNILVCAKKYDNYQYISGGGHEGNAQEWIDRFNKGEISTWEPILDATGLVRMAYVEAMGKEDAVMVLPDGYANSPNWEAIPLDKAEAGDIVTTSVHVAIVESNDPKAKSFKLFSAQSEQAAKEASINESELSYNKVKAAFRAKK